MVMATNGRRSEFQQIAVTVPKLLVGKGSRQCVLIYNNTSGNLYLGNSGTSTPLVLPTNTAHWDMFSSDEWWAWTPSSSGTVSGYVVF